MSQGDCAIIITSSLDYCLDREATDHECLTTITPGRCWACWCGCCWCCCCEWNWRKFVTSRCFVDDAVTSVVVVVVGDVVVVVEMSGLFVKASGTSWAGSSLNKWSPSRWRIASTIVSRFCLEVFAKYSRACGVPSSRELAGDGNLKK